MCLDPLGRVWHHYLNNEGEMLLQRKGNMNTLTAKELAIELNTDAKTVRKFLRSLTDDRAGKGGRWAIAADDLPALRDRFAAFNSRRTVTLTIADFDD